MKYIEYNCIINERTFIMNKFYSSKFKITITKADKASLSLHGEIRIHVVYYIILKNFKYVSL